MYIDVTPQKIGIPILCCHFLHIVIDYYTPRVIIYVTLHVGYILVKKYN